MKYCQYILCLLALLTVFFDGSSLCAQTPEQDKYLDSLRSIYYNSRKPEDRLKAIDAIAYTHYNADSTEFYAREQIKLSRQLKNKLYEAKGLDYLSWALFFYGEYLKSCEYAYQAILIADSIGNAPLKANNYYLLGHAFTKMQNQIKANEYFYNALDIYTEVGDSSHICDVLRNIADNDYENAMYDAAEECLGRSITIDVLRNDLVGLSEDNYYLGRLTFKKFLNHRFESPDFEMRRLSKEYHKAARNYARQANYGFTQMKADRQISLVLCSTADDETDPVVKKQLLDSCEFYLKEAYSLSDGIGSVFERSELDYAYTFWLISAKRHKEAGEMVDKLTSQLDKDSETYTSTIIKLCFLKARYFDAIGDFSKASHYKELYNELFFNSKQADFVARTAQNMAQAQFEETMRKREHEYETDSQIQRIITISVFIVLILAIVLIFIIIASYLKSQRINRVLDLKNNDLKKQKQDIEQQKRELEKQNTFIEMVNKAMTDGINYASLIQKSVMPSAFQMNFIFGDTLIYHKPLYIVSGDFYWATQIGHLKMLAVADCTGHGVPGAFLSMLGLSILNEIAAHLNVAKISTGAMLDIMRDNIKEALHQNADENENHDGMDVALIVIDTQEYKMHYSGAYRPVIIIRNGEAIRINPDRMPIGEHYRENDHFTDNIVDIKHNDSIYLFSDGITDQFGYDEDNEIHKFSDRRLTQLLTDIAPLPFNQQHSAIDQALSDWRTNGQTCPSYEQTDDIIILGIRVLDWED